MSIVLHPRLGVNARVVEHQCPVCGTVHTDELVMLGSANHVDTCSECGTQVYGGITRKSPCPKCKSTERSDRRELNEWEKVKGPRSLCPECRKLLDDGGVAFVVVDEKTQKQEYFRMPKDGLDTWLASVMPNTKKALDGMRGKVVRIPHAFWAAEGENIRLPRQLVEEDESDATKEDEHGK